MKDRIAQQPHAAQVVLGLESQTFPDQIAYAIRVAEKVQVEIGIIDVVPVEAIEVCNIRSGREVARQSGAMDLGSLQRWLGGVLS